MGCGPWRFIQGDPIDNFWVILPSRHTIKTVGNNTEDYSVMHTPPPSIHNSGLCMIYPTRHVPLWLMPCRGNFYTMTR